MCFRKYNVCLTFIEKIGNLCYTFVHIFFDCIFQQIGVLTHTLLWYTHCYDTRCNDTHFMEHTLLWLNCSFWQTPFYDIHVVMAHMLVRNTRYYETHVFMSYTLWHTRFYVTHIVMTHVAVPHTLWHKRYKD